MPGGRPLEGGEGGSFLYWTAMAGVPQAGVR